MTDRRPRILVVDDYGPSRYSFRRILGAGGLGVVEAPNAAETRKLLEEPLDLVLLDVNLPDANGMDLCREIRAARPGLPVVLISASYRSADEEDAWRAAGAAAFLEQPIEAEHLLETVRGLLS